MKPTLDVSVVIDQSLSVSQVGDSWFNSQRLRLPDGCEYEVQMRYGSIGWSVGATLGYAFASGPKSRISSEAVPNGLDKPVGSKRVLSLIGDGSFQMTAQDVSTMLRYSLTPIIILVSGWLSLPSCRASSSYHGVGMSGILLGIDTNTAPSLLVEAPHGQTDPFNMALCIYVRRSTTVVILSRSRSTTGPRTTITMSSRTGAGDWWGLEVWGLKMWGLVRTGL